MTQKHPNEKASAKQLSARTEVERRIKNEKRIKTGKLNLDGLKVGELPESLWELIWLTHLDADHCALTSIPTEIGALVKLRELYLSSNALSELPDAIGKLLRLNALHLHRNKLTDLPDSLWNLNLLEKLFLSDNQLSAIPEAISQLSALIELSLDRNILKELPNSIGSLPQLKELYLHQNKIVQIPNAIGQLAQLRILYLNQNELDDLPEQLRTLESLEQLFLHDNPKLELPTEVLGSTWQEWKKERKHPAVPKDLLNYYFSREQDPDGGKALNEVKLLLVGRGEAGKTSLVQTMVLGKPFDPNQGETPGIAIATWRLECGDETVTVHVWDFAGQEIAHETHRFFLSERSVYLLVLDGRRGTQEEDADYWLSHIQKYGDQSPVIVVLNKWQSPAGFAIEKRRLKRRYPFIQAFVEADCATGFGILALQEKIREVIASEQMSSVRARFPTRWFRVKEQLAHLRNQACYYLTYPEYRAVCLQFGISDDDNQESLARNLHRLGVTLYYGDNPRLRDTRVLIPDWVANGVYAVLRGVQQRGAKHPGQGFLPRREVGEVLEYGLMGMGEGASLSNYPVTPELDTHQFLLDLMLDRELCFLAEGEGPDAVYLLPELLSADEPEDVDFDGFIDSATIRFRYRYDILPDGVLSRLIVKTHPLSRNMPCWKRGVVLAWEDAKALILTDKRDRHLEVFVCGATTESQSRLTGIIRANLHTIHDELPARLNVQEEVNSINSTASRPLWTSVETLKALERNQSKLSVVSDIGQESEQIRELDPTRELAPLEPATARITSAPRLKLFMSYSHRDHRYRDNFSVHLSILKNEGLIDVWWDGELRAGQDWEKIIWDELLSADVVILLMSNPFFASAYIQGIEMRIAQKRYEKNEILIVPVLLERCSLDAHTWLKRIQALPSVKGNLVPIVEYQPNQRRGWHAVEVELRTAISNFFRVAKQGNKETGPSI